VVEGHGVATVTPDSALLQVGLDTEADSAADALTLLSQRSDAVVAAARAEGVDDSDVQTRGLSLFPQLDQTGRRVVCYRASYGLGIRLRNMTQAPALIDAVSKAAGDALRLGGVHLATSETEAARSEAGVRAVRDARQRAERLAETAGVRVGRVLSIVDAHTFGAPVPAKPAMLMAGVAQGPSLHPGSDEIAAQVTVTFEII
jgi:uncharacterized protein YggE